MFKSLYFKIVLILLIFIVAVMCAVSAILMNGVSSYFAGQFSGQMEECFGQETILYGELQEAAKDVQDAAGMKEILSSYGSILGIDAYRNYYVLDGDGNMLTGSDAKLGAQLEITPSDCTRIGENHKCRVKCPCCSEDINFWKSDVSDAFWKRIPYSMR